MALIKPKHFNPGDHLIWIGATARGMVEHAKYEFVRWNGEYAVVQGLDHPGEFQQPARYFTKYLTMKAVKLLDGKWADIKVDVECAMCGMPCKPSEDEYDLCKKCDGKPKPPRRKKFKTQLTINEDHLTI